MSGRQERVATAVRKEVASLVLTAMRDPRLAKVTITNATISRDLTHARVFVSVLGSADELRAAVDALTDACGFVRGRIGPRLGLRVVPDLHFVPDDSAARAQALERIFREDGAAFGPPAASGDTGDEDADDDA
jgi:ribosome-binding factor A